MVIAYCTRLGFGACALLACLSGCDGAFVPGAFVPGGGAPEAGSPGTEGSDAEAFGALSMPLATIVNGVRYRLSDDRFSITGPVEIDDMPHNGDGSIVVATLPAGDYEVTLHDGWVLERQTDAGFEALEAELASPNPRAARIESGATTTLVWLFRTDGTPVGFEPPGVLQGNLGVADRSNPGATLLGDVLATEPAHLEALEGIVTIQGSLSISGGVSSLQALSALTHIDGDLSIASTALTSLEGLESLAGVSGTLAILDNAALPTCAATALLARLGFEPTEVNVSGNDDDGACP